MVVLDVLALLFGLAGLLAGFAAVALSRRAAERSNHALEQSQDAAGRAAQAGELAGRAHTEALEAVNRSLAAGQVADRAQSQSVEALGRSAEALSRASSAASLARGVDEAARSRGLPPASSDVHWQCEQVRPGRWLIRNVGTADADAALVTDATRPPKFITAEEVIPRAVAPGDHLQFRVATVRDAVPPRVRVTWAEQGSAERHAYEVTLVV